MTDAIKKCSDCRHAVPSEKLASARSPDIWDFAKCHHPRSLDEDDGSRWHLGETAEKYSYCSTMRGSLYGCGKDAKQFEPRA